MTTSFERKTGKQRATSFLVRFWEEPRETEDGELVVRGYLRNLATGEERYIRDPAQLGSQILRHFRGGSAESSEAAAETDLTVGAGK